MSDIVFIEPNDDASMNLCALVLSTNENDALVAMAHHDVRLAGRLDLVLEASHTLPCAVAVFTHAVSWVSRKRIVSTLGTVSDDIVDIVLDCRTGIASSAFAGSANPHAQLEVVTEWFDLITEQRTTIKS